MAASIPQLPETMKALVLKTTSQPPTIETVLTPKPTIASAVVKIVSANVITYTRDVFNGKRAYPFPMPLIPGCSAIGRVVALGPDATKLHPGDLVFVDCTLRSRDDPTDVFLAGFHQGFTPGAQKLMTDVYRDWTFAEYCLAPLENLHPLNESRLLSSPADGGCGYRIPELGFISTLVVSYGGLRDIELQAGQTVIVAPATGAFGGGAVLVALAMGARVIAMGRNRDALATLRARVPHPDRLVTVPITGDVAADCDALRAHGPIDAFFDIGPPAAHASTHFKSAILALRHGARISLMGGYREDVAIPHSMIMHRNQRLYGKWMYERSDVTQFVKLVENGLLKLGPAGGAEEVRTFPLEQWQEAWEVAAENARFGQQVVLTP